MRSSYNENLNLIWANHLLKIENKIKFIDKKKCKNKEKQIGKG